MKSMKPGRSAALIRTEGECFDAFIESIGEEMNELAAEQLVACATETVQNCVNTYSEAFASDEVGKHGTGRAAVSSASKVIPSQTTGLLYGKVQSGKTNACIAASALAVENGFRCIVVLTSDNTLLGRQTYKRFRDQLTFSAPYVCQWEDWSKDPERFAKGLKEKYSDTGVILISTKNQAHLESLNTVLKVSSAKSYPGLVLDDEADHASLNTATAKEARVGKGGVDPSAIFDAIGNIRRALPHHIYLQITATPQSLLLQSLDHPCRPVFCVLSNPGQGYTGGDLFFQALDATTSLCCEVDPSEFSQLQGGKLNPGGQAVMPDGLRLALCTFFLGVASKQLKTKKMNTPYSFLLHLSPKRGDHEFLDGLIKEFIDELDRAIRKKSSTSMQKQADGWLDAAYRELGRTAHGLQPLEELKAHLAKTLVNARPEVINTDNPKSDIEYRPGMNILVGGNRLGRGVTINGLMVTYYGRNPKTKMTDTVHQHARMFGYRKSLQDVTRLFSSRQLLLSFKVIHDADEAVRTAIGDDPNSLKVKPVWIGKGLKPTRSNVLNPADVGALNTGKTIYPPDPLWKRVEIEKHTHALDRLLEDYTDDEEYREVQPALLRQLLQHMPSRPFSQYSWEDERVAQMLKALEQEQIGIETARLNVRRGRDGKGLQLRNPGAPSDGFTDSKWVNKAKDKYPDVPTLIVTMQEGRKSSKEWDDCRVYIPTLVLPKAGFVFMFNYT
jgi:hypothetical protein